MRNINNYVFIHVNSISCIRKPPPVYATWILEIRLIGTNTWIVVL